MALNPPCSIAVPYLRVPPLLRDPAALLAAHSLGDVQPKCAVHSCGGSLGLQRCMGGAVGGGGENRTRVRAGRALHVKAAQTAAAGF